jgi:hypothetical protein
VTNCNLAVASGVCPFRCLAEPCVPRRGTTRKYRWHSQLAYPDVARYLCMVPSGGVHRGWLGGPEVWSAMHDAAGTCIAREVAPRNVGTDSSAAATAAAPSTVQV